MKNNMLGIILLILVFISYLFVPIINQRISDNIMHLLVSRGIRTKAVVVEVVKIRSAARIRYQFRDNGNVLRAGVDVAAGQIGNQYKPKDLIDIYYFKKYPFLSKIEINLKKYSASDE